jgi:hypothetical protein
VLNTGFRRGRANESQIIKIIMKDPVDAMPVSFTTSNPHRLVARFRRYHNSLGRVVETLNSATIKNYQVVQAGERTRVVFNLNVPASHELRKDRNRCLVVSARRNPQGRRRYAPVSAPANFADAGTNANTPFAMSISDAAAMAKGASRSV